MLMVMFRDVFHVVPFGDDDSTRHEPLREATADELRAYRASHEHGVDVDGVWCYVRRSSVEAPRSDGWGPDEVQSI